MNVITMHKGAASPRQSINYKAGNVKLFYFISSFIITAMLSGCGGEQKSDTSSNQGDIFTQEKIIATDLNLVPKAHTNLITLTWTGIEGAQEYLVYRLQSGDLQAYVESNANATTFSFSTDGQQTYQVWVEALDEMSEVINSSENMTVTSAQPNVEIALDQGDF